MEQLLKPNVIFLHSALKRAKGTSANLFSLHQAVMRNKVAVHGTESNKVFLRDKVLWSPLKPIRLPRLIPYYPGYKIVVTKGDPRH